MSGCDELMSSTGKIKRVTASDLNKGDSKKTVASGGKINILQLKRNGKREEQLGR